MLTGSQEYAATLALHDFVDSGAVRPGRARHAADGERARLPGGAAPHRGRRVQPGAEVVRAPGRSGRARFSLQRLRSGGALLVRRLAKLVGSHFLDDVGRVPGRLSGRAGRLPGARRGGRQAAARARTSAFLLVLAPEVAAVDEALYFHERLREAGIGLGGFVANRVHPAPGLDDAAARSRRRCARDAGAGGAAGGDDRRRGRAPGGRSRARSARCTRPSGASSRGSAARAPGIPITEVPLLDHDVDNLAELRVVGEPVSVARGARAAPDARQTACSSERCVEHPVERAGRLAARARARSAWAPPGEHAPTRRLAARATKRWGHRLGRRRRRRGSAAAARAKSSASPASSQTVEPGERRLGGGGAPASGAGGARRGGRS